MGKRLFIAGVVTLFLLLAAFQNCSPEVKFAMNEVKLTSLNGEDVICDPFSSSSACAPGEGLKGSIYYLSSEDKTSPRSKVDDILNYGLKVPWPVVFSQFDVASRSWEDGFPSGDGVMKNTNGEPLIEWFAFELEGSVMLKPGDETEYQFALYSDDGSILWIDGREIVNHDGTHSPSWKCGSEKVTLTAGEAHKIKLKYFQGPRTKIALRVLWRPWSKNTEACGQGFTPVPSSVLFTAVR